MEKSETSPRIMNMAICIKTRCCFERLKSSLLHDARNRQREKRREPQPTADSALAAMTGCRARAKLAPAPENKNQNSTLSSPEHDNTNRIAKQPHNPTRDQANHRHQSIRSPGVHERAAVKYHLFHPVHAVHPVYPVYPVYPVQTPPHPCSILFNPWLNTPAICKLTQSH